MRNPERLPYYLPDFNRAADFVIYRAGVLTKAMNGWTGVVDFSAVNADVAFNGAISKFTNGGKIFIQYGPLYTLHAPIDFGIKAITLEGTSGGAVVLPTTSPNVCLKYHADLGADYMIKTGGPGVTTVGTQIKNIVIDCIDNVNCLGGIYLSNTKHAVIENVMIDDVFNTASPGYGINIERTGGEAAYYNVIRNIHTRRNTVGIRLGAGANACQIIGGQITGTAARQTTGILGDGGSTLVLQGPCDLESHEHANGVGMHIASEDRWTIMGLRTEGNMKDIVIDAGGGTGDHRFYGGSLYSAVGGYVPVTDNGNAKSYYSFVGGYKTEGFGTSTGTGAQQTIAHGLGVIPTCVMLSDKELDAKPYQSAAADITNIYVTAIINQDWSWLARI